MADQVLTVRLRAVVDGYQKAMDSAARSTEDMASRAERITAIGDRATETGGKLTRGLTLPIAGVGAAAVLTAGHFEAGMREVQALTQGTASEMEMLQGQALKMGADTQFSANEAAAAMSQLVKGGFDVEQTYSALPGVMQLAAAATIDIASAADIATNVLSGFGLEVENLAEVNDYLSQTANASDTDVRELGEAFKYVGPVARGAGLSLEETTAVMGLMAENGIRGSMAGTALRGSITALLNPSKQVAAVLEELGINVVDSNGELTSMQDVIEQLAGSGATAGQIMQIFGERAGPAMVALVSQGADALGDFTQMLEESGGVAQDIADAKMGGFTGAVEQLKGSLETLAITIGDAGLLSLMTGLADGATGVANSFAGLPTGVQQAGIAIAGIAVAAGPAIWAFGKLASLYAPVVSGLSSVASGLRSLPALFSLVRTEGVAAFSALGVGIGPGSAILIGVAALAAGLYLAHKQAKKFKESHMDAGTAAVALAESANLATREISKLNDEQERGNVSSDDFRKANEANIQRLRELATEADQGGFLMEIGYQMVLRGVSPEDALEQVQRLAEAAGVEVPVNLSAENIGEFNAQLAGVEATANRVKGLFADIGGSDVSITSEIEVELDNIATAAADAFQAGDTAGFVSILATAEEQLGGNAVAMNYLADQALVYSDVAGLSTGETRNLGDALLQMGGDASAATQGQKDLVNEVLELASAMDGGLTPANIAAAAAQLGAGDASKAYAKAVSETGDAAGDSAPDVEDFTGEIEGSGDAAQDAADALDDYIESIRGSVEPFFDMADALRANEDAEQALRDAQEDRAELLKGMDPDDYTDGLRQIEDAARSVEDAYRDLEDAQRDLEDSRLDLERINEDIAEQLRDLADITVGTVEHDEGTDKLKDMLRDREDAERDIEDAQRGVEEAHRGISDAQRDHADARRDLTEAQNDARVSADELAEADRDVEAAQQRVAETALDVEEAALRLKDGIDKGTLSTEEFDASLQGWVDRGLIGQDTAQTLSDKILGVAFASGIAKAALDEMYGTIERESGGGGVHAPIPPNWRSPSGGRAHGWRPDQWREQYGGGKASGGSVRAGFTYDVGEEGPERLTMFPGGGGMVTPSAMSAMPATGMSDSRIVAELRDLRAAVDAMEGATNITVAERPGLRAEDIVRARRSEVWLRTGRS